LSLIGHDIIIPSTTTISISVLFSVSHWLLS